MSVQLYAIHFKHEDKLAVDFQRNHTYLTRFLNWPLPGFQSLVAFCGSLELFLSELM